MDAGGPADPDEGQCTGLSLEDTNLQPLQAQCQVRSLGLLRFTQSKEEEQF